MISEQAYIDYFTNLATTSKDFEHEPGVKDAFFYLPEPWDLSEIDNAIKSSKSVPFMTLESMNGDLENETAENHVQIINGQIMILDAATVGKAIEIREARSRCLLLGLKVLARLKYDYKKKALISPMAYFNFNKIAYDPVGPIATKHYGYAFRFKISCPFGYVVDSTSWTDIEAP